MKKILFSVVVAAMLWSCGKDDGPAPSVDENSVPVIASKTFTVAETISDTEVIGKVTATDADDDTLTFTIATNDGDLFEITSTGDLSLASGKTLDAATKEQHAITVKVDDGEDTANATITIKVTSVAPTNEAPEMADQEFMAAEDITVANEIGQVVATDPDEDDTLTFELTANDNDLFAVSESGVLTLAEGKTLDYETATSHSITVSVTDGEKSGDATITITVENVIESMAEDPASFVTTWETEVDGEEIVIGSDFASSFNFTIDWGDGTEEKIVKDAPLGFEHVYEKAGTYTVAIAADTFLGETFPTINFGFTGTAEKLKSIDQWGYIQWQTLSNAFYECVNMVYNAKDAPDLSIVTDMTQMFYGATSFDGDLSDWDTSNVTTMVSTFAYASSFNGDVSTWKTFKVTDMTNMFSKATSFNGNISGWDVSNVKSMNSMFDGATSFNADISSWETSNVTGMQTMFRDASSFNKNIGGWETSKVTSMSNMFSGALVFDQNLGSWDIGSVTNMTKMLDNSGMSKENLNATIIGWHGFVTENNGPLDIIVGVDGLTVCGLAASEAGTDLKASFGWDLQGAINVEAECN